MLVTRRPGRLNSQQPQAIRNLRPLGTSGHQYIPKLLVRSSIYHHTSAPLRPRVLHCDRQWEDCRQWWQLWFCGSLRKEIVWRHGGDVAHRDEKKSTCLLTDDRADEDDDVTVNVSVKVRHPRMTISVQEDDLVMLMPRWLPIHILFYSWELQCRKCIFHMIIMMYYEVSCHGWTPWLCTMGNVGMILVARDSLQLLECIISKKHSRLQIEIKRTLKILALLYLWQQELTFGHHGL
jgi:hypothetical protein